MCHIILQMMKTLPMYYTILAILHGKMCYEMEILTIIYLPER